MQWNKLQLQVALALSIGDKKQSQIADELGVSPAYVNLIKKKIKGGDKPDLSEEAIANAPEAQGLEPYKFKPKPTTVVNPEDEVTPPGDAGGNGKKPPPQNPLGKKTATLAGMSPGMLRFSPVLIQCQFTPILYMGKLASINEWGWPENMSFEDWMDLIVYHFFKDRGITLQAYVVDTKLEEEVPA